MAEDLMMDDKELAYHRACRRMLERHGDDGYVFVSYDMLNGDMVRLDGPDFDARDLLARVMLYSRPSDISHIHIFMGIDPDEERNG